MIGDSEKHILLLGAGTTHLPLIQRLRMERIPGARFTLVSESYRSYYSAMIPGVIAGRYTPEDAEIDLLQLCKAAGIPFICARVISILNRERHIELAGHSPLSYDYLSINLGSISEIPAKQHFDSQLAVRPLFSLPTRLAEWERKLQTLAPQIPKVAVVGSGATGCEMILALKKRFSFSCEFILVSTHAGVLPGHGTSVTELMKQTLKEQGIRVIEGEKVESVAESLLHFKSGNTLTFDGLIWATEGMPVPVLASSLLEKCQSGFIKTQETLVSHSDANVFVVGDSAHFTAFPTLPKNGVYAVRQAPVLWANLKALVDRQPLLKFKPQKNFLSLLNTSDGEAILSYGTLGLKNRWALFWKTSIDKRWMQTWRNMPVLNAMPQSSETDSMLCGGCGAKVSSDLLARVLGRLEASDQTGALTPLVAVQKDDAAVLVPSCHLGEPEGVELQTVDVLRGMDIDPYLFGQIAALHSVSDIWAMNGIPKYAQAIVSLPPISEVEQEELLEAMLWGAREALSRASVSLVGGHSYLGVETTLGFSVSGTGKASTLFRKVNLREGDQLLLTKPLGTGVLLRSYQLGKCKGEWFESLIHTMLQVVPSLTKRLSEANVRAVTDVTGFGLLGHLWEMCEQSQLSARINLGQIPLLPGAQECFAQGIRSTMHQPNAKVASHLTSSASLTPVEMAPLLDPQTAGGMLIGVSTKWARDLCQQIQELGFSDCRIIGEVIRSSGNPKIEVA